jgi:hypothetical protein
MNFSSQTFFAGLAAIFLTTATAQSSQSTFSPARPPAIPLAVRSPYFNTWQFAGSDGGNGGYLAGKWQQFWQLVHHVLIQARH